MTTFGPQRLLTTRRAAAILGVDPVTLRRWRAQGHGPAFIRLTHEDAECRAVRYRREDLEAWIAARVTCPAAGGAK